jgi:hypothetical protein
VRSLLKYPKQAVRVRDAMFDEIESAGVSLINEPMAG